MSWIGGAISAAGSLLGGLNASDASTQAAQIQAQSGQAAIDAQMQMYNQNRADLAPYRQVGQQALYTLADYLGLPGYANGGTGGTGATSTAGTPAPTQDQFMTTGGDQLTPGLTADGSPTGTFGPVSTPDVAAYQTALANWRAGQNATPGTGTVTATDANTGSLLAPFTFNPATDPGYNAGLNAGFTGITNASTATGGTSGTGNLSGATLKELLAFGQQYAGTQQQIDFSQNQAQKAQTYGMLSGTAGMGQGATNTTVSAGTNTAGNVANTLTGIGNAQAAGTVGSANALSSGLTGAANSYNQNLLLSSILKNQNPGVSAVNTGVSLDPSIQPM